MNATGNSAPGAASGPAPFDAKRFSTLQACGALAGHVINVIGGERPTFAVFRFGLEVEVDNLDELEHWLVRAGVQVPQ